MLAEAEAPAPSQYISLADCSAAGEGIARTSTYPAAEVSARAKRAEERWQVRVVGVDSLPRSRRPRPGRRPRRVPLLGRRRRGRRARLLLCDGARDDEGDAFGPFPRGRAAARERRAEGAEVFGDSDGSDDDDEVALERFTADRLLVDHHDSIYRRHDARRPPRSPTSPKSPGSSSDARLASPPPRDEAERSDAPPAPPSGGGMLGLLMCAGEAPEEAEAPPPPGSDGARAAARAGGQADERARARRGARGAARAMRRCRRARTAARRGSRSATC